MGMSSGPSNAAQEQQRQADARDRAINQATQQVNAIFNDPSRQQQIADYQGAVQQRGNTDLTKAFDDNARQLKFAMARSGLTSGSADVDLHDRLNDDYGKGVLQVLANAKQAGSSLRGADEASRARLIGQVSTGYGLTEADQNAASALRSNLEQAQGAIAPQTFDQLFGQWADIYNQSQINQSRRQAEQAGLGTLFNQSSTNGARY